ncbi:hypothetical protein LAZ67_15001263 [Cordylochernes scorpioides]|uniref:Mos1 transposase HTH domain-containing protein n=1 Tax=Cordylochernes scorpioides TaxID=51811 RepID=A0ABY6L9Q8_9ARAC|nr:hypothetical protein LAZ67_15001263 [Cordylochernes scorpioides]
MAISEPKSTHLREVLLFAFNWKKSATEAHRMLEEVHGDHALSKSQCYRWFKKFQSGDFELDNEPRGKPHQKFEDAELQALHEKKSFLHRIVTSDEKSIHFSNPMRQKSWVLLGQFPKRKPRPNRLGKKTMLCVWWDQTGVVYFKLLKPGETVNTSRYEQQMHSLREGLNEKRPELLVKNTIKDLGWELLPHPPYSPDLAPSDYHLFTSLGHALKNQEFSNSDILRKWLVDWFDSKGIEFFRQGIRKLPERWSESRRRVFEWYKRFKEDREETADNERSGRPSTSTTPEKVDKVLELVREDRRITVREVAEEAGISFGSTQSIMKDILGVRSLNAVLVPKDLTFDQKNARKETYEQSVETF